MDVVPRLRVPRKFGQRLKCRPTLAQIQQSRRRKIHHPHTSHKPQATIRCQDTLALFFREHLPSYPQLRIRRPCSPLPGGSSCTPHCNVSLARLLFAFLFLILLRSSGLLHTPKNLEMRGVSDKCDDVADLRACSIVDHAAIQHHPHIRVCPQPEVNCVRLLRFEEQVCSCFDWVEGECCFETLQGLDTRTVSDKDSRRLQMIKATRLGLFNLSIAFIRGKVDHLFMAPACIGLSLRMSLLFEKKESPNFI